MLDANSKGKRLEDIRHLHKPAPDTMHEESLVPGRAPKATIQDVSESSDKSTMEPGTARSKYRANTPDVKTEDTDLTDAGEGTIPPQPATTIAMEEQALWATFPVVSEAR